LAATQLAAGRPEVVQHRGYLAYKGDLVVVDQHFSQGEPLGAAPADVAGLLGRPFSFGAGLFQGLDDIVEGGEDLGRTRRRHGRMIPVGPPTETTVSATAVAGRFDRLARNGLVGSVPSITLDADAKNTAVARRFVDQALAGVAADAHLAALLVSELVSNVIRHAATAFELVVTVAGSVRVEVRDGAAVTEAFRDLVANPPRRVDPAAPGGRGLMLISTLASGFGLEDLGAHGKSVWFELPIDPSPQRAAPSPFPAKED
jgi:anti-sigma regulatory factor (Ser/Thr protein kinase)